MKSSCHLPFASALLVLCVIPVFVVGCRQFWSDSGSGSQSEPEVEFGSVVINVRTTGDETDGQTVSPARVEGPENDTITGYRVYGDGPWGLTDVWSFDLSDLSNDSLTISQLFIGSWEFEVDALNSDGVPILSGRNGVDIRAGVTTTVEITLGSIEGQGALVIEFRWPSNLPDTPTFQAELRFFVPGEGFSDPELLPEGDFELEQGSEISIYRYGGTHAAGYYKLLHHIDGEPFDTYPFRLRAGLETTVIIDLETGEGSGAVVIIKDPQNPLTVELSIDGQETIPETEQLTIISDVSGGSGLYHYRWYVNGVMQEGQDQDALTLGPGLASGTYRVTLVADDGTVLGSGRVSFVVESPSVSLPDAFTSATVRAYQSESVPEEDLYMILKAGMNAPSARGTELWEYIVVQDASVLAGLADEFDWLPAGTARFAIIVCANLDKQEGSVETWPIDVGFASQALRAQATKLGIASVPCRISPEDDGRIARFRELFAIPDRVVPAIVIPFGYPAELPAPQAWDDSIVYWDSWE